VLWLDSASMLWARVMRGMNSTEKAVTPRSMSCCVVSVWSSGRRKQTRFAPGWSWPISAWLGAATFKTRSAASTVAVWLSIRAPASSKALSS
jgi:hypothetical protein